MTTATALTRTTTAFPATARIIDFPRIGGADAEGDLLNNELAPVEDDLTDSELVLANGDTYLTCMHDSSADQTMTSWQRMADLAYSLRDEQIMDIMRGWDMEDGAWLQDSPLVLRFELQDVVLEPADDGELRIWQGVLDDESDCMLRANWLPDGAHLTAADRARLQRERCRRNAGASQACWLPYQPLLQLVGKRTTMIDWLALGCRIARRNRALAACLLTFSNALRQAC